MQGGLVARKVSVRLSVRPFVRVSVSPSVKRVDCDKTEKYTIQKTI